MPLNQETNSSKTVWNSYALARWNFKEVLGKSEVWVDDFEYNWLASQGGGGGVHASADNEAAKNFPGKLADNR